MEISGTGRRSTLFVRGVVFVAIVLPVCILIFFNYTKIYEDQAIASLFYSLTLLLNALIGYLILNFLSKLNKSERELRAASLKLSEANVELEERVKQRTMELAKINRVLEEAKVKDESILLAIGDGLVVTDKNGDIIFVNNAFERLLGWRAEEIIGRKMAEVIPREDEAGNRVPPEERMSHLVLLGKKATTSATTYFVKKDNKKLPVALTVAPIIFDNKISGAVEVFRDITIEKEVDRAKTEFVSLASHQLRTPLSTVKWHTELLLGGDLGKISRNQRKYLEDIYHANERMVDLVNALLNASRIELGTFMVNPEPLRFEEVAHDVVEELKPQIKERKITFAEEFEKDIPVIQADRQILTIIFQNLLSNAVKYTPKGGTVTLSVSTYENNALISVQDTGYGIPQSQQSKIFTKLFRADNAREKETDGNGLGLYIVKYVVNHVGGKIWFESQENKGSTFYVALPLEGMKKKAGSKHLIS